MPRVSLAEETDTLDRSKLCMQHSARNFFIAHEIYPHLSLMLVQTKNTNLCMYMYQNLISGWDQQPYHMSSYRQHHQQQQYYDDQMIYENQYRTPPPLLPPKSKKNKFLKGSLAAIKNALLKSTRPLRRQNSMVESKNDRPKAAAGLRRQHSMMEHRDAFAMRSPQFPHRQHQLYDELDYSQRQRMGRSYRTGDPYYGDATYMNQSDRIYDNYPNANSSQNYYEQENLYANRALIELERKSQELQYSGGEARSGNRIVRRHSMADRTTNRSSPMIVPRMGDSRKRGDDSMLVREDIYQTRSGAFMMDPHMMRNGMRTREEEAIYQSRREMHLDHLYQSKTEMQQRIHQGRMEVERAAMSESPSLPSSSSATTPVLSDQASSSTRDPIYQSRRELKEKGFKTRTQLRDHIYQSRREAMESMAEPMYISSKRVEMQRHQEPVIYESKEVEAIDVIELTAPIALAEPSPDDMPNTNELLPAAPSLPTIANQNSRNSSGSDEEETLTSPNESDLQKTVAVPNTANDQPNAIGETAGSSVTNTPLSPRADRGHLSNIIKRIAPQPPPRSIEKAEGSNDAGTTTNLQMSRTSIETHYTSSQISLPIGPPAAQSTPYTSDMTLEKEKGAHGSDFFHPPLREQTTTRGVFDANGGTLNDNVWNVSINIPPGAIPAGFQQEIYFTVTDPRMSQDVGGPPLDMENGWCCTTTYYFFNFISFTSNLKFL